MFARQQTLLAIISLVVAWKVPEGIRTILLAVKQLESVMNNREIYCRHFDGKSSSMGGLCIQPRTVAAAVESSNFGQTFIYILHY